MILKFLDFWILSSKDEITLKGLTQHEILEQSESNNAYLAIFFKSCTSLLDIIQSKLEIVKPNADNSSEK